MTDQEKRRLLLAFAIAKAENEQIDEGEMGMYFWGKYASHYLAVADRAMEAFDGPIDEDLAASLAEEVSRR